MRAELLNLSGSVGRHAIALETLAEMPESMRGMKDSFVRMNDVVMEIHSQVQDLNAWRSDDKTQRIVTLESEIKRRDEEVFRDRLDFRRSVRSALLSALCTLLLVAIPAAYLAYHLRMTPAGHFVP
jgi:hypothetical protein